MQSSFGLTLLAPPASALGPLSRGALTSHYQHWLSDAARRVRGISRE